MLRRQYDTDYFTSPLSRVFSQKHKIEILKSNLRGTTVLDLGCGSGEILAALPDTYYRMGVDVSEDGIALAKKGHPGIDFRVLDVEKETIDRSFDTVIALDVFEHLADPDTALKRVTGMVNSQGRLIMSVPNNHRLAGLVAVPVMNRLDATHISTLKRRQWQALLRKHGWKITTEYNKLGSRLYTGTFSSYIGTSVMFVAEKGG